MTSCCVSNARGLDDLLMHVVLRFRIRRRWRYQTATCVL
jgi:hypothetical protein